MSLNLTPLADRVVVRRFDNEPTTKSGIVLPDTVNVKPQQGEVLAAGAGRVKEDGERVPMDVKVGDKVLFARYAGAEFKVEGEELLIFSEKDILGIVAE
jgi:chaperonin GroES